MTGRRTRRVTYIPHSAASGSITSEYTAAGTENVTDPSTSTAMKIASVPLCRPISNDEAMACFSTTPKAFGTTYPTTRLIAQNAAATRPTSAK